MGRNSFGPSYITINGLQRADKYCNVGEIMAGRLKSTIRPFEVTERVRKHFDLGGNRRRVTFSVGSCLWLATSK